MCIYIYKSIIIKVGKMNGIYHSFSSISQTETVEEPIDEDAEATEEPEKETAEDEAEVEEEEEEDKDKPKTKKVRRDYSRD